MEIGRAEFYPYPQALPRHIPPTQVAAGPLVLADRDQEVADLKRQLALLSERVEKAEQRLDHVEPTVEGLDQTVRSIARQSDVEMWDE